LVQEIPNSWFPLYWFPPSEFTSPISCSTKQAGNSGLFLFGITPILPTHKLIHQGLTKDWRQLPLLFLVRQAANRSFHSAWGAFYLFTIGVFGVKATENIEQFKAFSQNMMHGSMDITDRLYGNLAREDVKNAISSFGGNDLIDVDDEETLKEFREFQEFKRWRKQLNK
jgi:hypothetical protein